MHAESVLRVDCCLGGKKGNYGSLALDSVAHMLALNREECRSSHSAERLKVGACQVLVALKASSGPKFTD